MKNSKKINNLQELRGEIARLSLRRREQEAYLADQYDLLKVKVGQPFRFIERVTSHIPGVGMLKGMTAGIGKAVQRNEADWLTRVLQIGAPLILNSTLLKKAGWLKKAVVLLASETAIGQVNKEKINGLIDKITAFVKPGKKKRRKTPVADPTGDVFVEQRPVVNSDEQIGI